MKFYNINANTYFPSSSKNAGVKFSKYKWLAFMDCGLKFDKNWLIKQVNYINENILEVVSGVIQLKGNSLFDACCVAQTYGYNKKRATIPSTLIKKDVFLKNGYFIERRAGYDRVWPSILKKKNITRGINDNSIMMYEGTNFANGIISLIRKSITYSIPTIYLKMYYYPYLFLFFFVFFVGTLFINYHISILFFLIYIFLRTFIIPFVKSNNFSIIRDYPLSILYLPIVGIVMDISRIIGLIIGLIKLK